MLNPFEQVCAMGFWRAPCNVDFLGRCIACTKSINGTITKAADPYTADTCEWQCSVGFWQFDKTVCTKGDRLCNKCKPCNTKVIQNSAEKFIFVISVLLIHFFFLRSCHQTRLLVPMVAIRTAVNGAVTQGMN